METNKKLSFFERINISVFKLENYGIFIGEKFSKSIKYFLLLILMIAIIVSLLDVYDFCKIINKTFDYIKNELPDFSYADGILKADEVVEAYDQEYKFYLYINTTDEINEETLKEYKTHIYDNGFGLILLNNKLYYYLNSNQIEYSYKELSSNYSININNKNDLIQKIDNIGIVSLGIVFFLINLFISYITNFITTLSDCILVAIFGFIASKFCRVRMKGNVAITLAIYSLTLSVILSIIYTIIYDITGFEIKYFSLMYLLIAYVYIIAAILMIKDDLIKQSIEVEKIIDVQKQVKEELESEKNTEENNEEEQKNKNDENPKENDDLNLNNEPDGSEI